MPNYEGGPGKTLGAVEYTESYIEYVFNAWYSAGCPSWNSMRDKLDADEYGRVPHVVYLRQWAANRGWYERKDAIMTKAQLQMEDALALQTVEMWKRQAMQAAEVSDKAFKYIIENGFDSSSSAIRALEWAHEEERKTLGAESFLAAIKDSSSHDLIKTIRQLAERQAAIEENQGDIIDLDDVPEDTKEEDAEP